VVEKSIEIDFYTDDKILIESKFYSELTTKQRELFLEYPANKRMIIDSVEKISLLDEI